MNDIVLSLSPAQLEALAQAIDYQLGARLQPPSRTALAGLRETVAEARLGLRDLILAPVSGTGYRAWRAGYSSAPGLVQPRKLATCGMLNTYHDLVLGRTFRVSKDRDAAREALRRGAAAVEHAPLQKVLEDGLLLMGGALRWECPRGWRIRGESVGFLQRTS